AASPRSTIAASRRVLWILVNSATPQLPTPQQTLQLPTSKNWGSPEPIPNFWELGIGHSLGVGSCVVGNCHVLLSTTHRAMPGRWLSGNSWSAASARWAHSSAMRRDSARPYSAGYVGLPAAASLPAVFPRSADAPATSRMSSTI